MKHLFLIIMVASCLYGESITLDSQREYEILERFFRTEIREEGLSYVLDGSKPIDVQDYYGLDNLIVTSSQQINDASFAKGLLYKELIPLWKKLNLSQEKFVLKTVPFNNPGEPELGWEIMFINLAKLREEIDANLNLFRYVLGPTTTTDDLINRIAFSQELLSDILSYDRVLEGIVLGYGANNSLMHGRTEEKTISFLREELPPHLPNSNLLPKEGNFELAFLGRAVEKERMYIGLNKSLTPHHGYTSFSEECSTIEKSRVELPECLSEEPKYVCGAYKSSDNNKFFNDLVKSQKNAQALLKDENLVEKALAFIDDRKVTYSFKKPSDSKGQFLGSLDEKTWLYILNKTCDQFQGKGKQNFIKNFCESFDLEEPRFRMGVSPEELYGLELANKNLFRANKYFEGLTNTDGLVSLLPGKLYYKTTLEGNGSDLKQNDLVRVKYVISDSLGDVLYANNDTWLSLSQSLPSFVHAVQGMRVNEEREIYIHPSVGYGVMTLIPLCSELIMKVTLKEVNEESKFVPSELVAYDFSEITNDELYKELQESLQHKEKYYGAYYRSLLDRVEGSNKEWVLAEMKKKLGLISKE